MTEKEHHISESADKIVLKAEVKRGTSTRDQDKINVKVKGDNPEATAQKLHNTVLAIRGENTVNELRDTQASDSE